jgi:hypothetical protein
MEPTKVTITVNRKLKNASVTGDALAIRDAGVELTLANVRQDDIDAGLVFEAYVNGRTLGATSSGWTVDEAGNALGVFSTNTVPFARLFAHCDAHCKKVVSVRAYAADPLTPIFNGRVTISNFTAEGGECGEPVPLPTPSGALEELEGEIESILEEIDAIRDAAAAALEDAIDGLRDSLRQEFADADTLVSDEIHDAVTEHNISGSAHADIRNLVVFCGSAIYMQCNEGALADGKWRKLVPAEPNEFGEYMWMVKQAPAYTYSSSANAWEEESQ